MVRLADVWSDVLQVSERLLSADPLARLVIPLPGYHQVRSFMEIQARAAPLNRSISTLDEYVDACWEIFQGFKEFGAVAFKDQSAYFRTLDYSNPTKDEAERVFNRLMADGLRSAGYPDELNPARRLPIPRIYADGRDLYLPVQLHTGHLAGLYGDIPQGQCRTDGGSLSAAPRRTL